MTDIVRLAGESGGMNGGYTFTGSGGCNDNSPFYSAFADSLAANRDVQAAHWIGEQTRDILSAISTASRATDIAVEKIGAANILDIHRTANATQTEMLKQFCEVKELVREEATRTRELQRQLFADEQAVKIQDLKTQLLACQLTPPAVV